MLLYLELLLQPYCPSTLSAEKCVVKSVASDPSSEYSKAQRDATAGLGGEKTINQEKILESAAKHMTEETHGRERKRHQKQRRDRRTETIQVTHLLTKRINYAAEEDASADDVNR